MILSKLYEIRITLGLSTLIALIYVFLVQILLPCDYKNSLVGSIILFVGGFVLLVVSYKLIRPHIKVK